MWRTLYARTYHTSCVWFMRRDVTTHDVTQMSHYACTYIYDVYYTCMPRASVYIDYTLWYVMLACHSVYILLAYIYHTAFIYVTWGYFNLSFLLHCIAVIHLSPFIGSAIIHLTYIVIHTMLSYTQSCNDISNHGLQYNVRRFTLDVLYTLAWFIPWPWNISYALYPGCAIHPSMIIPWIWYIP